MKQFIKFLTKIKSFWKLYRDYEYDGETVAFIIENYQDVLQNRTKLMSKPTYYASEVVKQIDNWYEEMGYVRIERMDRPKYIRDKFKTILPAEELAFLIWDIDVTKRRNIEEIEEYLEKKVED